MKLFLTGYIQTVFVVINVYLVAHEIYIGVLMSAFMISYIWTHNVKRIAFGTHMDRVIYSLGASLGSLSGLLISTFIIKRFLN